MYIKVPLKNVFSVEKIVTIFELDLDKNFVEIIKKWYEENNIDTCENYGDVNDEVRFESKLNESPLKTPKSYKKTRRLIDSP